MKALIICMTIGFIFGGVSLAQIHTADEIQRREGRFVNITLLPGAPVRIFVAGREQARLDLSNLKVQVMGVRAGRAVELKTNRDGNYYMVESNVSVPTFDLIQVKTKLLREDETFEFKLKTP